MVGEFLLAVDIQLEMTCTLHVDDILACLLRSKGRLVLGREVLDGEIGSEDVHTCSGDIDRLRVVFGGEGLALHIRVVPECALQSALAVGSGTLAGHVALEYLIVSQIASRDISDFLLLGLDAVKDGDGMIGRTVVVTPHHRLVVRIRTDDGNLLCILLQRQDIAVVLQQDDALAGHIEGDVGRSLGGHGRVGDLRPLHEGGIVHLTQIETTFEQTDDVLVDFSFADQTTMHGLRDATVGIAVAALNVCSSQRGLGRSGDR